MVNITIYFVQERNEVRLTIVAREAGAIYLPEANATLIEYPGSTVLDDEMVIEVGGFSLRDLSNRAATAIMVAALVALPVLIIVASRKRGPEAEGYQIVYDEADLEAEE